MYSTEQIKEFVQWCSREGWEYNWKSDKYEYKPLSWRPKTFEEVFALFNLTSKK